MNNFQNKVSLILNIPKFLRGSWNQHEYQDVMLPDEVFEKELISMFRNNFDLYQKLDSNADLKDYVNRKMFDFIQKKLKKDGRKNN